MYVPDSSVLRGLSVASAQCFGMPHAGAHYAGGGVRTNRLDRFAECAICGAPASNSHHVPPVGMGARNASFTLHGHKLRPALIALCGSGTTGCHGLIHAGMVSVSWGWDDDEAAEEWWSGRMLERFGEHSPELYGFGRWVVKSTSDGRDISEIRLR